MSNDVPAPETPPEGPPDAELVARAQQGDVAAYEELIRRYQGRIYGLIYHMTSHKEDTEDLVQTVFVKAYQALGRFRGQSAFYTWLYRIAINYTINFLKTRKRRQGEMSLNDIDQAIERDPDYVELVARDSPVRDATLSELHKKLNAALLKLSDKHRTVVVMHDIQGLPHDEIARMLGTSVGTVRSRLFYARQLLQSELAEFAP